ncbi:14765_t:CDS:2 [Funneliformis geosporum]|uniref:9680_t:CDS:1 n=1 Tax=Funneliformis geosporum TaxID=1117311 RepID=A0A9W4SVQ4_9GLOM|nr:14765_t:CDS:2 [Funneliformis geosporum]CAI2183362.1 9680_t:CDS:2 [Funneliformis geosporum]
MKTRAKTANLIKEFFSSSHYAVVGASSVPTKYGNRVLKWYMTNNRPVTPINPNETLIEGLHCVPNLYSLTSNLNHTDISVSVITPPKITKTILEEANKLGIKKVWLQPGAEDTECQEYANQVGIDLICGGPCVLVDGPRL